MNQKHLSKHAPYDFSNDWLSRNRSDITVINYHNWLNEDVDCPHDIHPSMQTGFVSCGICGAEEDVVIESRKVKRYTLYEVEKEQ